MARAIAAGAVGDRSPLLDVDELVERFDAVTLDDLRELTAELWAPERLSAAGIGPDEDAFRAAVAETCPAAEGLPA